MSMMTESQSLFKLIYIEDDEPMKLLMQDILKDDFEISVTSSIDKVRELCENEEIAIVMADHHMKPFTGIEILKELYENHPDIRRVLITGDKSSNLILNAVNQGHIHGFFHKPVDFEKLKKELREYGQRYLEHKVKEKQNQTLQEEIVKLREALYQRNSRIYHTFTSLGKSQNGNLNDKITDIYVTKIQEIQEYWKKNSEDLANITVMVNELRILSDEFDTSCFSSWLSILDMVLKLYQNENTSFNKIITDLKREVSISSHQFCRPRQENLLENIILTYRKDQLSAKSNYRNIITELLTQIDMLLLNNPELIQVKPKPTEQVLDDLGYILVVIDQVTIYSKVFNAKTDIHPSLIGNLAIAVNDFSKELFDDFSGVQRIDQETGQMLIHRADQSIYYVAMTYSDSYIYEIYLQEFAKNSLELFQAKNGSKTFTNDELCQIDQILDNVVNKAN